MRFSSYHDAVQFLEGLDNIPRRQYMEKRKNWPMAFRRFQAFLRYMGNPERGFTFVHVGGTSGKGSVVRQTHAMLQAGGRKTGSLYSPHVTTSLERILVGDRYIHPQDFSALTEELKPALSRFVARGRWEVPSYYEIFTVLALQYFRGQRVTHAVLEVGVGGAYDATNVIPAPAVAIVTNVGTDHAHLLGKTRTAIAKTKMQIIKRGTGIALTAETTPRIVHLLHAYARQRGVPFEQVVPEEQGYVAANAALAARAAQAFGISPRAIARGLAAARMPGRFETVAATPRIIMDCAHNNEKIGALADRLRREIPGRLHVVFSCAANKDGVQMIRLLAPLAHRLYLTRFLTPHRMCYDMAALLRALPPAKRSAAHILIDPRIALAEARKKARPQDTILVTGSTFLVGDLRQQYVSEERILEQRTSFPHAKRR